MIAVFAIFALLAASGPALAGELETLLPRLGLDGGGGDRGERALALAAADMLSVPEGREAARDFLGAGAAVRLRFSRPEEDGEFGGQYVDGLLGGLIAATNPRARPPEVIFNRMLLGVAPELLRAELAGSLAHEVFGHALEAQRPGLPERAFPFYRGDETNARLLGWLVRVGLRMPREDPAMARYLDPRDRGHEAYYRWLSPQSPSYAATFGLEELSDPLAASSSRIGLIQEARGENEEAARDAGRWLAAAEHFPAAHGEPAAEYEEARREAQDQADWVRLMDEQLDAALSAAVGCREMWLQSWSSGGPQAVAAAARDPHFGRLEALIRRREAALRAAAAAAPPLPAAPSARRRAIEAIERRICRDLSEHPSHFPPAARPAGICR